MTSDGNGNGIGSSSGNGKTDRDSGRLQLFLTQGEANDQPVLPDGLPRSALLHTPEVALPGNRKAVNYPIPANPNSLEPCGWGLVVPRDESLRKLLLDAVRPLLELRAAQMRYPSVEKLIEDNAYIAESDAMISETDARDWLRRVYLEEYKPADQRRSADKRPQYLLALGDLHQVPETLLRVLAQNDALVGRLAFSDENGNPQRELYRCYAEKVRAAEDKARLQPAGSSNAGIYGVVDGTAATDLGYQQMVLPMHQRARQKEQSFRAKNLNRENDSQLSTRDDLWNIAADLQSSVLFTMSHGYGGPEKGWPDSRTQRLRQGAMSFMSGEPRLTAEAAASMQKPFLANGIWFMFACYGAGTPPRSHFYHWLKEMPPEMFGPRGVDWVKRAIPQEGGDNRPFTAALPANLLARENGPLAFIGHLDLAWGYGFQTTRGGSDPEPFVSLMRDLLRGTRVGVAFSSLTKKRNKADGELLSGYNRRQELKITSRMNEWTDDEELRKQESWMTRQDLSGYVILGDPAARLPLQVKWTDADEEDDALDVAAPKEKKEEAPKPDVASTTVQVPISAPISAPITPATPIPVEKPTPAPAAPPQPAPVAVSAPVAVAPDAPKPTQSAQSSFSESAPVASAISAQSAALPFWKVEELMAEVILGEQGLAVLARKYGLSKREVEKLAALYRSTGRAALLALLPDWDRD